MEIGETTRARCAIFSIKVIIFRVSRDSHNWYDSKPNEFSILSDMIIQLPFLFSLVAVYIKNSVILSENFAILSSQIDVRYDDYQHDGRKL